MASIKLNCVYDQQFSIFDRGNSIVNAITVYSLSFESHVRFDLATMIDSTSADFVSTVLFYIFRCSMTRRSTKCEKR